MRDRREFIQAAHGFLFPQARSSLRNRLPEAAPRSQRPARRSAAAGEHSASGFRRHPVADPFEGAVRVFWVSALHARPGARPGEPLPQPRLHVRSIVQSSPSQLVARWHIHALCVFDLLLLGRTAGTRSILRRERSSSSRGGLTPRATSSRSRMAISRTTSCSGSTARHLIAAHALLNSLFLPPRRLRAGSFAHSLFTGFALGGNPHDRVQLALPWLSGIAERSSPEMNALLMGAAASGASEEAKSARATHACEMKRAPSCDCDVGAVCCCLCALGLVA